MLLADNDVLLWTDVQTKTKYNKCVCYNSLSSMRLKLQLCTSEFTSE